MKKMYRIYVVIMLAMLQLLNIDSYSQYWVYFTGSVTEIDSDKPISNWPVLIAVYDSLILKETQTNQAGLYFDSLFIEPVGMQGAEVSVFDCDANVVSQYFQEIDSINIADFSICKNDTSCFAFFDFQPDFEDPYTIHFFNLSQGDFNIWEWNFGDGIVSDEYNPVHQFNSPGFYEVCLTIYDSAGLCESNFCGYVAVSDSLCIADFDWEQGVENPLIVNFTDLSTGDIAYWYWDFGDMSYSEEQSPVHQYANAGLYYVTLTVVDSFEVCFDVVSKWVDVGDSTNCIADLVANLDTLNNTPNVYIFEDLSTVNPVNWLWDFGDGEVSFEQNPQHTYEQSGVYEVCLTVSSDNGTNNCFDTKCQTITTLEYYNFGGQVFIGDYPLNIEEDDSSNKAIAYLFRRYINQWELMDTQEFWKYGYYWFVDKPEGEYIIRTDLIPGSVEYGNYAPVYHNNESSWNHADIFMLNNDEEFAVNVSLKPLAQYQTGIGSISGHVEPGLDCEMSMPLIGELVYLLNANYQLISYTYTNDFGVFAFEGLGLSNYIVKAEVTGKKSPFVNIQLDENNATTTGILLDVECNSYVGIVENQPHTNFSFNNIYPQPASEKLSIDMNAIEESQYQFEIIAIDGKIIWTKEIHTRSGNQIIEINIPAFMSGLYLLRIKDIEGDGIESKKIIIK